MSFKGLLHTKCACSNYTLLQRQLLLASIRLLLNKDLIHTDAVRPLVLVYFIENKKFALYNLLNVSFRMRHNLFLEFFNIVPWILMPT